MKICIGCGQMTVDPTDEARYDVLRPEADLDNSQALGPYCGSCWPSTVTGAQEALAGNPGQEEEEVTP